MEPYLRQQFDMLLLTAAERFSERIVQRCEGQEQALRQLRANPNGEGVWLADFVDAVFAEFCLDNAAGACFVLEATQKRTASVVAEASVADILAHLAKSVFAQLLSAKTAEALERAERYG